MRYPGLGWDVGLVLVESSALVKSSVRVGSSVLVESPARNIGGSDNWDYLPPPRVLLWVGECGVVGGRTGIVVPWRLSVAIIGLDRDNGGRLVGFIRWWDRRWAGAGG